jgi:ferredoxin
MAYLKRLSARQVGWLVATLLFVAALATAGFLLEPEREDLASHSFTTDMTIQQIAPQLDATGAAMAKEMHLPRSVAKDKPLRELDVEQAQLDEVVAHLAAHRGRPVKYYLFAALSIVGIVWLTRLGRPDGSQAKERKSWYPRVPYYVVLGLSVAICGFLLGKSPNPMEGGVKIFKGMVGLQVSMLGVALAFIFFVAFAMVGNKIVCGWACPFGALQELLYSLPILKRAKRRKLPFWLTNSIRGGLFVLFLLLLFGIVGSKRGFVVYHFMNPFNLFNLRFETPTILLTVVLALGLGLIIYRPFCQLICPFGFISWIAERVSLTRVLIDRNLCNQCGACSKACPLPSAQHIVEGRFFGADCYSCARCLRVCPDDALRYGSVLSRRRAQTDLVQLGEEEVGVSS